MAWDYQTALVGLMASYDAVKNARSTDDQTSARSDFTRRVTAMRNVPCPETHALLDELVYKLDAPKRVLISPKST